MLKESAKCNEGEWYMEIGKSDKYYVEMDVWCDIDE